jgi:hypothetical protein
MPNIVHFWSDQVADWSTWEHPLLTFLVDSRAVIASTKGLAEKSADADGSHTAERVNGAAHLASIFRAVLRVNYKFDQADFHTHGGPGTVVLGKDPLNLSRLGSFENQSFEKTFNKDATITFHGCNIGDEADGEYFLVRIGEIFLRGGGGKALGNTGMGVGHGAISGKLIHPLGKWVTAKVTPGGAVSLSGHTNLVASVITERFGKAVMRVEELEQRRALCDLKETKNSLYKASEYVTPQDFGSWAKLWQACSNVENAEKELDKAETASRPRPRGL